MSEALIHKKTYFKRVSPCLRVRDIQKTLHFYEQTLGFETLQEHNNFASVKRDDITIEFRRSIKSYIGGEAEFNQNRDIEIEVEEIEALYNQLARKTVRIINDISENRLGYKNFQIEDCNGYVIVFTQPAKPT